MTFAEWINEKIDALRAMIVSDDKDGPETTSTLEDGVREVRSAEKLALRFVSNPSTLARVRKSIEKFSIEAGLDQPACDEIGLVVNEALANVIRHAYDGAADRPIEMDAENLHPGVRITIRDWGKGVDPASRAPKEKDPMVPGGLGLICMRKLMNETQFQKQPDGMLLVMTRTTPGSKAAMFDATHHPENESKQADSKVSQQ